MTRLAAASVLALAPMTAAAESPFKFRHQEIDRSLAVGYGVIVADLNGDRKPDIVVADKHRVIWFANPDWTLHTILDKTTVPDNVTLDAHDVDGDGKLDLALGAGWRPPNTTDPGTVQWLRQGADVAKPWPMFPITGEPSVHRIRFADLDGNGKAELIVSPLQGKGTTAKNNWSENPVRLQAFHIPPDPAKDPWRAELIDHSLFTTHNFQPVDFDGDGKLDLITASYDGVHLFQRQGDGQWKKTQVGEGDQRNPKSSRGSSELKLGKHADGKRFIATIEPWHGNTTVVYTPQDQPGMSWERKVIDTELKWGHAVWCVDLDGDGGDEIVIGVRDPLNEKVRSGVNVFKAGPGGSWVKHVVDAGGMATEDLCAADLNGDGKVDLVAVGRATKNVKVYWNETARP